MKKNIIRFVGRVRKDFGILCVGVATIGGATGLSSFRAHIVKLHEKALTEYYWFTAASKTFQDEATATTQVNNLNVDPPAGFTFSTMDAGGTAYEDGYTSDSPEGTPAVIIYKNPS